MKNQTNLTVQQGWLKSVHQLPSKNADKRPDGLDISLIVIHGISLPPGEFGGEYIDQLFCNSLDADAHPYFSEVYQLRVSSHILIKRDGSITQYVPFEQRAWHAGVSSYKGREQCNDYSIGIELEGTDDIAYTDVQYEILNMVIRAIRTAFPTIGKNDIVGHCHIAPSRKTDPGASFEWAKIGRPELDLLNQSSSPVQL
jgi:AmpD protein